MEWAYLINLKLSSMCLLTKYQCSAVLSIDFAHKLKKHHFSENNILRDFGEQKIRNCDANANAWWAGC